MRFINKKGFSQGNLAIMLTIIFIGLAVISYAEMTIPHTFTPGTTISSGEVNENFSSMAGQMPAVKTGCIGGNVSLGDGGYSHIVTLSINSPGDGYVYLTANGFIELPSKTTDGFSIVYVGITDDNISPDTPLTGNFTSFYLDEDQEGGYKIPFGVNAVFSVTAGEHTFHISAYKNGAGDDTAYLWDSRLTAIFIPNTLE